MSAPASSPNGPLSPEHLAQLSAARAASRRVRRVAGVARASAWTTAIFGAITLVTGVFGGVTAIVLGVVLVIIGVREGHLASRLARYEPRAAPALAINQLILGSVIVIYAAWQAWNSSRADALGDSLQPMGDPQVDAMLADFGQTARTLVLYFYLAVGVCGALATACMALYYRSAAARVREFVRTQPDWVVQAMRAAV